MQHLSSNLHCASWSQSAVLTASNHPLTSLPSLTATSHYHYHSHHHHSHQHHSHYHHSHHSHHHPHHHSHHQLLPTSLTPPTTHALTSITHLYQLTIQLIGRISLARCLRHCVALELLLVGCVCGLLLCVLSLQIGDGIFVGLALSGSLVSLLLDLPNETIKVAAVG